MYFWHSRCTYCFVCPREIDKFAASAAMPVELSDADNVSSLIRLLQVLKSFAVSLGRLRAASFVTVGTYKTGHSTSQWICCRHHTLPNIIYSHFCSLLLCKHCSEAQNIMMLKETDIAHLEHGFQTRCQFCSLDCKKHYSEILMIQALPPKILNLSDDPIH